MPLLTGTLFALSGPLGLLPPPTTGAVVKTSSIPQSILLLTSKVEKAYQDSNVLTISHPTDLFPPPAFVPGNRTLSWTLHALDVGHGYLCLQKEVESSETWADSVQGFSRAGATSATADCKAGPGWVIPDTFPVTLYARKMLSRNVSSSEAATLKLVGLPPSGPLTLFSKPNKWSAPAQLNVQGVRFGAAPFSLVNAPSPGNFLVTSNCFNIPALGSCQVWVSYYGSPHDPVTGTAQLTFSDGSTFSFGLQGLRLH